MSIYANSSKIRVYSIGYGSDITGDISTVLNIISNANAAFYQPASDSNALNALYTKIAGDLIVQAGGSTTLDLNLGTITVDGVSGKNSYDYLNYTAIPVGGRAVGSGKSTDSTYVDMYHTNMDNSLTDYYHYIRGHQ